MKLLVIIMLLLLMLVAVTGCLRDKGQCNYDGNCVESESDECADCQDVLGRDVDIVNPVQKTDSSP